MVVSSPPAGQLVPDSRPRPQVYVDLIHSYSNAGEYSPCFTELQRNFISSRPTKLKSLIRLVKHWYQQVRRGAGPPAGGRAVPPQRCPRRMRGPAPAGTLGWWSRERFPSRGTSVSSSVQ